MDDECALHPIERLCQSLLRDGRPGEEPAVFAANAAEKLAEAVARHLESVELLEVVDTLCDLADDLEDAMGSRKAAELIRRVVRTPKVLDAVRDRAAQACSDVRFGTFVGPSRRAALAVHAEAIPLARVKKLPQRV